MSVTPKSGCVASCTNLIGAGLARAEKQEIFTWLNLPIHRNPVKYSKEHYFKAFGQHIASPIVSAIKVAIFVGKLIFDIVYGISKGLIVGTFCKGKKFTVELGKAFGRVGKDFESIGRNTTATIPLAGPYLLNIYAAAMAFLTGEKLGGTLPLPLPKPVPTPYTPINQPPKPQPVRVSQPVPVPQRVPVIPSESKTVPPLPNVVQELRMIYHFIYKSDCLKDRAAATDSLKTAQQYVAKLQANKHIKSVQITAEIKTIVMTQFMKWMTEEMGPIDCNSQRNRGRNQQESIATLAAIRTRLDQAKSEPISLREAFSLMIDLDVLLCNVQIGMLSTPEINSFRKRRLAEFLNLQEEYSGRDIDLSGILEIYRIQLEDDIFWKNLPQATSDTVRENARDIVKELRIETK